MAKFANKLWAIRALKDMPLDISGNVVNDVLCLVNEAGTPVSAKELKKVFEGYYLGGRVIAAAWALIEAGKIKLTSDRMLESVDNAGMA